MIMRSKLVVLFLSALLCHVNVFSQSINEKHHSVNDELCGYGVKKGCRVLYIGDSITDGNWGGVNSAKPSSERALWDMNHIYGHGYVFLCASYYLSTYPEMEYEFFNRGISGNTLQNMADRWDGDALSIRPDVLSILIGTNDVEYYLSSSKVSPFDYDKWEQTYRRLLDESRADNPKVKFVLATPFTAKSGKRGSSDDYEQRRQMVEHMATIVTRIAKDYHAVCLPFDKLVESTIKNHPQVPTSYWVWDGVHPTAQMHKLMADMWINSTKKK
jgi:lysophospholipase L1-like esterase